MKHTFTYICPVCPSIKIENTEAGFIPNKIAPLCDYCVIPMDRHYGAITTLRLKP